MFWHPMDFRQGGEKNGGGGNLGLQGPGWDARLVLHLNASEDFSFFFTVDESVWTASSDFIPW